MKKAAVPFIKSLWRSSIFSSSLDWSNLSLWITNRNLFLPKPAFALHNTHSCKVLIIPFSLLITPILQTNTLPEMQPLSLSLPYTLNEIYHSQSLDSKLWTNKWNGLTILSELKLGPGGFSAEMLMLLSI